MTAALDQWAFTSPHEGVIPHLYLDSRGNVTAGVGFLIPDEAALRRLPWYPNVQTALVDYSRVRAAETGHVALWYRKLTIARLRAEDMRRLFEDHVLEFRKAAVRAGWRLERYPLPAQIAIVDMAFNLGVGTPMSAILPAGQKRKGLGAYKELFAAVEAGDWSKAARECKRGGIGQARNDATAAQFLACVAS